MRGFTMIDLAIVIIYLAAVLFAGMYFSKKKMTGKEYSVKKAASCLWLTFGRSSIAREMA